MYKLLILITLLFTFNIFVLAQSPDDEDYNENEVFVGYVLQRTSDSFNGIEASYTRNVSRYFGVKGDVSGTFRKIDETLPVGTTGSINVKENLSVYNLLGGVQIKDNAKKKRIKPFAHALIGVHHSRDSLTISTCTNCPNDTMTTKDTLKQTGFSGAFGGGLDIKLNKKIDIRAIQVDYNPLFTNGNRTDTVRFSFGIVFK